MSSSGGNRHFTLVCFDVADKRRLRRVAKALLAFGERRQRSVFECWLSLPERRELVRRLLPLIDPDRDSLRLYELGPAELARVVDLGMAARERRDRILCA